MSFLLTILVVVQVLSALGVIVLVLLQHGKGADLGAAFGSGTSGSLFGATGSANFLSRTTGALATVFLVSTLALAFVTNRGPERTKSVMEQSGGAASVPGAATDANGKPASGSPAKGETKTQIPR